MTLKQQPTEEFNLATADKFELKAYAKETYNLPLTLNMSVETMQRHIHEFCQENNLEMPFSEAGTGKTNVVSRKASNEEKITINIATAEGENGDKPIFLGVNGLGYTLPRGIDIDVKRSVVEVLKNAKQDIVTQDKDGAMLHREVLAYPYQVVAGTV